MAVGLGDVAPDFTADTTEGRITFHGEDVIIVPAVTDEDAKKRFPKGFVMKKPYLRVTAQP